MTKTEKGAQQKNNYGADLDLDVDLNKLPTHTAARHAYSPRNPVAFRPTGSGKTKQAFKDDCDINLILKRFERTGLISHTNDRIPTYQDIESFDFHQAMDIVAGAKAMFSDLPSGLRDRFANDPARLLDFIQNPDNRAEAISLGILNPAPAAPASAAPAAPAAAPGPGPAAALVQ